MNNISLLTGIVGCITGFSGLILSILNFLRDKPNIQVILKWDMSPINLPQLNPNKNYGVISVTNIGRRSIFISHVHLKTPIRNSVIFSIEGIKGEKLLEGDPPKTYYVDQEILKEYSKYWQSIRAAVYDSTGKEYISLKVKQRPKWAEEK